MVQKLYSDLRVSAPLVGGGRADEGSESKESRVTGKKGVCPVFGWSFYFSLI